MYKVIFFASLGCVELSILSVATQLEQTDDNDTFKIPEVLETAIYKATSFIVLTYIKHFTLFMQLLQFFIQIPVAWPDDCRKPTVSILYQAPYYTQRI